MRIVLDLQGCQSDSRGRGIGRYSLSLCKAILRNARSHEVLVALNGALPAAVDSLRGELDGLIPAENIRVWACPAPVDWLSDNNAWRREAAEVVRESFLRSLNPDVVHVSSPFDGFGDNTVFSIGRFEATYATVATLYDLIPLIQSETYLDPQPRYRSCYEARLEQVQRADALVAISASARDEALKHLGSHPESVFNISAAADAIFQPGILSPAERAALGKKFGISGDFVFYSGASDERKNHLRLIEAYARLPEKVRDTHQLVLAGGMPDEHVSRFKAHAAAVGIGPKRVITTGRVTDRELLALYRACRLFILPSLHEGFGLPALEAMSCGAAVIGSATSSIPEVIGLAEAMFDPYSVDSMVASLQRGLTDPAFRERLLDNARERASLFSWDRSAQLAIAAFERAHVSFSALRHASRPVPFDAGDELDRVVRMVGSITPLPSSPADMPSASASISQNLPSGRPPRLFVDVSQLVTVDAKTGIQRVVRSIISELLSKPPEGFDVSLVYSSDVEPGYRYAHDLQAKYVKIQQGSNFDHGVIEAHAGDVFLGLDLQHHVVISHDAYYASLRRMGVKVYFVIYDLLPILLPHAFPEGLPELHPKWLGVISRSDGAVCISRAVADEFLHWLDVFGPKRTRPLNVGWFHLGADLDASVPTRGVPADAPVVLSALESRPTFLMVGTVEPRKGQSQTLAAFDVLWADGVDVNLVIVGKPGWNVAELVEQLATKHPERGRRLFWLSTASDEYLQRIYEASDCLVAACDGEGFGLPLIEAAQFDTPIIARDIPVFREVAGPHAHYFAGERPEDLSEAITAWLSDHAAGRTIASSAMARMTWQQSVGQLTANVIADEWYARWLPKPVHRFWPTDPRFGTQSGTRRGRNLVTHGEAGYVLHGPYMALPGGPYRILVHLDARDVGDGDVLLDAAVDQGRTILGSASARPEAMRRGTVLTLDVELEDDAVDVEARLFAPAGYFLSITLVEIQAVTPPLDVADARVH